MTVKNQKINTTTERGYLQNTNLDDYGDECLNLSDENFISIKNKNIKFDTSIMYSKKYKKFFILLMGKESLQEMIFGEAYNNINQIYEWVVRNIDVDYVEKGKLAENIQFNYRTDWASVNKGRLFYALDCYEKDADFKNLLLLLLI